jgi:hypothetical protein
MADRPLYSLAHKFYTVENNVRYNIKMDMREIEWKVVDWIHVDRG